jgi:hypothetical protein
MTNETFIRPSATITITGPDGEHVQTIDVPELVIENPYPADRLEQEHSNEEN